jgi:hypothetical protein
MSEDKLLNSNYYCEPLAATISPRQCLANVTKAKVLRALPGYGPGYLRPCLSCPVWQRLVVSAPTEARQEGKPGKVHG